MIVLCGLHQFQRKSNELEYIYVFLREKTNVSIQNIIEVTSICNQMQIKTDQNGNIFR